ncbi:MAG: CDP-diacylglycerol--serine O-phosphatidyltransferase, partial [Planctomycetaceae bacterium]|nr:CDP-diacylglycerol--serine O-phosphatidyltransferase [Planctomycetaceae bacterium]
FLMLQMIQFHTEFYHPRLLWVIDLLFAVCTILRLARFNVETDEDDSHEGFSGLPSPAAAGTVASFPIAMRGLYKLADTEPDSFTQSLAQWLIPAVEMALPLITLAVAALMVSRIQYAHVFNQLFTGQRSRRHVIQLVFSMALIFLVRELAIPVLFCYFAFSAPIRAFWEEVISGRLYKSKQI